MSRPPAPKAGAVRDVAHRQGGDPRRNAVLIVGGDKTGDDRLSTLRRYVHALGGDIEVYAVIDGKRVQLQGV